MPIQVMSSQASSILIGLILDGLDHSNYTLAHTQLRHADWIERLLLAVAIATLWCHELGERVLKAGEATRREIDPGAERELSLFQLGLRWLKRCIANALQLLPVFVARLSPVKLAPVMKSSNC